MPTLFPTIIPQHERIRFVTEIDRRVRNRLLDELNKWKTRGPSSSHRLMQILLSYVGQAIILSNRMCMEWLSSQKPRMSETRFEISRREIEKIGRYWGLQGKKLLDSHKRLIAGTKITAQSARDRIEQEALTWTDSWIQDMCKWAESNMVQPQGRGSSRQGSTDQKITMRVALENFNVSRSTLVRAVAKNELNDFRPPRKPKIPKRRGRRPGSLKSNLTDDARIAMKWAEARDAGEVKTYADFAQSMNIKEGEVREAVDRHRAREKRVRTSV